jgi:peptide deformylase
MVKPLTKIGNPILRKKAPPIPAKKWKGLRLFLKTMAVTMRHAQGVGLAANQVGSVLRAFVMENKGSARYPRRDAFPLQAYLNPRIVRYSKAQVSDWEGCLSIPGFRGKVPRAREVVLEAFTPEGRKVRKAFRGFEARVVQHEVDHLNGFFYIDRMKDWATWMHLEEFNRRLKLRVQDRKK